MSEKHIYMILHPSNFLIASSLTPDELGKHYLTGSNQYFNGKLIFAEIDLEYRNPYFEIEWALGELVPHQDGRPKATKFISAYRVLENMDFKAIKNLYLASSTGAVMELEERPFESYKNPSAFKIFAGITPLKILAMSTESFIQYGSNITQSKTKGAPKCFYTQIEFDANEFQKDFKDHPLMPSPIPGVHPAILDKAIEEIKTNPDKISKGIKLYSSFHEFPSRLIRHGFLFTSKDEHKFYPMPPLSEIEDKFYSYFKSM